MRVGRRIKDNMARFEKTRIRWFSAVLGLLALYALAGFAYAWHADSGDSMTVWAIIAVLASIAAVVTHKLIGGAKPRT